ncbi:uncharacterized protein PV09_03979 [Verruconis gallopava]|uniref:Uncharacterized protein n=1 Tax=Verruconis gallopava TaxID=253628 RepID=A0A0D1YVR6_9PEZI|nr:uncharacterized protein PV09_03979 [Verruconis gallopava]KIW04792.1 hypothetical protein PV09_03979 [Verruconis gallopava]
MSKERGRPDREGVNWNMSSAIDLSRQSTLVDSEGGFDAEKIASDSLPSRLGRAWNTFTSLCTDWWLTEIFCWCFAALCILLIAVLLCVWDGRPLPNNFPLGLKLNTYVSVLSATAKLALAVPLEESLASQKYLYFATGTPKRPLLDFERFELAARRPIGSVKLIWRMKARSFATLGAIIFLLSFGLDPFFQQLVSYPSRPSTENRSRVPRVVTFDNTNKWVNLNGTDQVTDEKDWRSVIPTFYRFNSSSVPLDTFCPGDSCTWPDFETLAVCSDCRDISSYLTFACSAEDGSWRQIRTINETATNSTRGFSCGWFFNASSSEPMLMNGYSLMPEGGVLLSRQLNFHDPGVDQRYWGGELAAPDIPTPIAGFAAVSGQDIQSVYRNETPDAFSCSLRWCVKRMRASFSEGVYTEKEMAVFVNNTIVPEQLSYSPDTEDWQYHQNITLEPPYSDNKFLVTNSTMLGARFALDRYIPNSIIQQDETTEPQIHWPTLNGEPDTIVQSPFNNLWLKRGMVPKLVDNLALQLTNALRNDPTHAITVYGSGIYVTYIDVGWGYFVFPLAVLVMTLVMLVATIVQTTKKKVWKASDLTTLVHSLSAEARDQFRGAGSLQEVRAVAREMRVCLTSFENGRHLQIEHITSNKP